MIEAPAPPAAKSSISASPCRSVADTWSLRRPGVRVYASWVRPSQRRPQFAAMVGAAAIRQRPCVVSPANNNQIGMRAWEGVIVKKVIVALLATVCAMAVAAPASAQYPDRRHQDDRAVGGRRRHRQHLPPLRAVAAEASSASRSSSPTSAARRARSVRARPRARPRTATRVYAVHDYIHLVHYAGSPTSSIPGLRADLPGGGDAVRAHREPQDAVEGLAGVRGRRQEAARRDLGRRHARLDQPHLPGLIEKAAGIKLKYVSYDGLAPRMNAILGGHIDLTDSNLTQKGKVEAGQLKFLAIASETARPRHAQCADAEGARHQHRLRGGARPAGAEGHAEPRARQARSEACAQSAAGAGVSRTR